MKRGEKREKQKKKKKASRHVVLKAVSFLDDVVPRPVGFPTEC